MILLEWLGFLAWLVLSLVTKTMIPSVITWLLAMLWMVAAIRSFQIRVYGTMFKGKLSVWEDIVAYTWVNIKYHDRLRLVLNNKHKPLDIPVAQDSMYVVGGYLAERLQGLYQKSGQSKSSPTPHNSA